MLTTGMKLTGSTGMGPDLETTPGQDTSLCPAGQGQGCRVSGGEKEEASHMERHEDFFLPRLCSGDTGETQKMRGGETNSP